MKRLFTLPAGVLALLGATLICGILYAASSAVWYPEGAAPRQGDNERRSLHKINALLYDGLTVSGISLGDVTVATATNIQLNTIAAGLDVPVVNGTTPLSVTIGGGTGPTIVTVTPSVLSGGSPAVGDALSYLFAIDLGTANGLYLQSVRLIDANDVGQTYDIILYDSVVTVAAPDSTPAVSDADQIKSLWTVYSTNMTTWADEGLNQTRQQGNLGVPVKASAGTSIYGFLRAVGTTGMSSTNGQTLRFLFVP